MEPLPAGSVESSWVLSSTAGLPIPLAGATAYLLVGNEIVGYTGFGPGAPTVTGTR